MNIFTAITGKLLPYTILFIIIGIFSNYIMFGVMQIPFSCGFTPLNLTTILFVIATQALAVFLFSLFPAISIIISIVSMVGSIRRNSVGRDIPCSIYVSGSILRFIFIPRPPFCRDQSKLVVRRLWICLYMAEHKRSIFIHLAGYPYITASEKSYIKS